MLDIHTHLYFPDFGNDLQEVLRRAFGSGIRLMVSVGTEFADHEKALAIARMDERIMAALGLHPHYFNERTSMLPDDLYTDIERLRQSISRGRNRIVAVGECGLDYFSRTETAVSEDQKRLQKEGFVRQIELAASFDLPVIVHCRDAYEDTFEIIRHYPKTFFILHCYMGNTEVTEKFLGLSHVYFSFTGNITYPVRKDMEGTPDDIRETVKLIPLERMFAETDCPFLAPVPYRGKRNEPSYAEYVIHRIAELKHVDKDRVSECFLKNAGKVFGVTLIG